MSGLLGDQVTEWVSECVSVQVCVCVYVCVCVGVLVCRASCGNGVTLLTGVDRGQ